MATSTVHIGGVLDANLIYGFVHLISVLSGVAPCTPASKSNLYFVSKHNEQETLRNPLFYTTENWHQNILQDALGVSPSLRHCIRDTPIW